jgi:signal transduction histidine kinase
VTARHASGEIEVAVRDDGMGIDPAHLDRIFRPYFTTKKQGTGLGLFVTRRIVEEYGGKVAFESVRGVGTTFRVRLPSPGDPVSDGLGSDTAPEHVRELAMSAAGPGKPGENPPD